MQFLSSTLIPLLLLVAGCYCAPKNWLDIGGTLGYESTINGTIGGHLKADRDGLSVNGTGGGILGASWAPKLIARGHAKAGDKIIAGDASLATVINNSWRPSFTGEIGRNSNGTWMLGFNPSSELNNTLTLTPRLQVKTGNDARALVGMPVEGDANKPVQNPTPVAPPMPQNPYAYNPYGYNPYVNMPANPYAYNPMPYGNNMYGYNPYQQYGQPQVPQIQGSG